MNCIFCPKICKPCPIEGEEYACYNCKIHFILNNNVTKIIRFNFYKNCGLSFETYHLTINFEDNTTIVSYDAAFIKRKILLEINSALNGVTPQNIEHKLKTLLTFS